MKPSKKKKKKRAPIFVRQTRHGGRKRMGQAAHLLFVARFVSQFIGEMVQPRTFHRLIVRRGRRWSEATALRRSLSVSCGQPCPGCLREKNPGKKKANRLAVCIQLRRLASDVCLCLCLCLCLCVDLCIENGPSNTANPTNPEPISTNPAATDAPIHDIHPPLESDRVQHPFEFVRRSRS